MSEQRLKEGGRVVLLRDAYGENDEGAEVRLGVGTVGTVSGVRECGNPRGPRGPWLYDVDFAGPWGNCWLIYDAQDVDDLARRRAVRTPPTPSARG